MPGKCSHGYLLQVVEAATMGNHDETVHLAIKGAGVPETRTLDLYERITFGRKYSNLEIISKVIK